MTKDFEIRGAYPAIVTPFTKDARDIDYRSLKRLIEHVLSGGSTGLVVCGSTGEAATLSDNEYRAVLEFVVAEARNFNDKKVIAGVGSSSTSRSVEMAEFAKGVGVDNVLVVTPPYNKPSQAGIAEHMRSVSDIFGSPVIAYNVPSRTGGNLLPATAVALAKEGVICAIKESSGSFDQMMDLRAQGGDILKVVSGEDSLVYAALAIGAIGTISVTANVLPNKISEMVELALAGDFERACAIQFETLPLTRALFLESNPIPVKAALEHLGIIQDSSVRLPLIQASSSTKSEIKRILAR